MLYPLSLPPAQPLITLTHPAEHIWIIELHNGQDSRLTAELVDHALKPALDTVERDWRERWRRAQDQADTDAGGGAVIIIGRRDQDKFFSNGLDLPSVLPNPNFFPLTFNPLLTRLLTFPIPTIAAINGHCFAGGFMVSLACDYRVMIDGNRRNAWLCMNEVQLGAVWPLSFAAILSAKIRDGRLHRKIALEGHRFSPPEALEAGILDYIVPGNTAAVLAKAMQVADMASPNARTGVWGLIKSDLYHSTLKIVKKDPRMTNALIEDMAANAKL